jgi:receptor protein-tyrosine kinase
LGFTSVVGGHCTLDEALQETEIPGLSVLTSGPLPPSPFKILNSRACRTLIEQLGQHADLVVIDAPPVLGMVDARLIASWVDGTVLVISCKDVGRREVSRSTDSLIQGGAELLGTVLSKVPQGVNGTYNYYGYRYNQLSSYYDNGGPQEGHDSGDGSTSGLVRASKDS